MLSEKNTKNVLSFLRDFNGFYSWIEQSSNSLRAGVDHVRSYPLFYSHLNNVFYLSDNADWILKQVSDVKMSKMASEEFQLSGFVTGPETLYPNLKQLQAGEFIEVSCNESTIKIKNYRYFLLSRKQQENIGKNYLKNNLHKAALASVRRLINRASGRQIVVPLSGGYDSRLIVTLLKSLGYSNVVCFSYGLVNNKESLYSKSIAYHLGFKWHFVEYSESLWNEAWISQDRKDFQKWASGWTSIPHVQDWLAVKILKKREVLQLDCIFCTRPYW